MRGCRSSTSRPPDTNRWPARKRASELPVTAKTITSGRSGGSSEELIIPSAAAATPRVIVNGWRAWRRPILARDRVGKKPLYYRHSALPLFTARKSKVAERYGNRSLLRAGCRTRRRQRAAAPRLALLRAFDRSVSDPDLITAPKWRVARSPSR